MCTSLKIVKFNSQGNATLWFTDLLWFHVKNNKNKYTKAASNLILKVILEHLMKWRNMHYA